MSTYDNWKADTANRAGSGGGGGPNDRDDGPEYDGPDEPTSECGGCGVIAPCTLFVDPPLEVLLCEDCSDPDEPAGKWHARMVANTGRRAP
jgi:hypothetical protein